MAQTTALGVAGTQIVAAEPLVAIAARPVELEELRPAAAEASMELERVVGEDTQMCCVLTRRQPGVADHGDHRVTGA